MKTKEKFIQRDRTQVDSATNQLERPLTTTLYPSAEEREKILQAADEGVRAPHDGLGRRGFLECMAWAGSGMLWTVSGGLLGSTLLPSHASAVNLAKGSFSFV